MINEQNLNKYLGYVLARNIKIVEPIIKSIQESQTPIPSGYENYLHELEEINKLKKTEENIKKRDEFMQKHQYMLEQIQKINQEHAQFLESDVEEMPSLLKADLSCFPDFNDAKRFLILDTIIKADECEYCGSIKRD